MKPMRLIKFTIVLLLLISCNSAKSINNSPTNVSIIDCSIDLTKAVDDKLPITINLHNNTSKSLIYRLPKVVQGTYDISDFGQFVDNFEAFDAKGNKIPNTKIDINSWEIKNAKNLSKITYLVNDTFDSKGINDLCKPQFPAGTNIDLNNYVLNLHGFIGYFDSLIDAEYNLTIKAPTKFNYATALKLVDKVDNEKNKTTAYNFFAPRYFDLVDNPMMFGELDVEEFMINDLKIVLSIYSPNKVYNAKELKNIVLNTMQSQVNYLKDFKATSRYDIQIYFFDGTVINPKDYGALEHHTSTVMVLPENTKKAALYNDLKYFISHEFFHIITPLSVHSEDVHNFDYNNPTFSKHLWMYEGVPEYFSKLFQIDQKLISNQEFYDIIQEKIQNSKKYEDDISFTSMSENILNNSYHKNYPNVYQKGALIAMCLDILIRNESDGKRGLLSLMNELSVKYGKNVPFQDDNLINEITKMTYPSIGSFLKNHVEGKTPITYQKYFDMVGLDFKDEKLVSIEKPTYKQLNVRDSWLNQHSNTIAFENVNVIPMNEEIILKNQRVITLDSKIISIQPSSEKPGIPLQTVIDGTGKYLIPGLSEMHYHWRNARAIENEFKLLIANGITTVRNMAEYDGQDHISIKKKAQKGEILAPNYFTTGPYLSAANFHDVNDVIRIVKEHKEKGYDFLKIGDGDGISKEIYLKILEEAQKYNIPVIGHAEHNLPLEFSLRMKSIEHVEEFVYIFNKTDFKYLNNDAVFLDNAAKQIKNSGVYVAPTLVIFEMITQYLVDSKFSNLKVNHEAKYLTHSQYKEWLTDKNHYRADFKGKNLGGVDALTLFNNYFEWMKKFTKILQDRGVPLLTGSDTFGMVIPGFSLHHEFEFLQESGLTPFEILTASTVNSSRYLNTISSEGTISEGKNANLVLLNNNPLLDIKNTKSIEGVMLKGKWYDREQLNKFLKDVELLND